MLHHDALPCDVYGVCCVCFARWDEGRAVAAAERRRDALFVQPFGGVLSMVKGTALFDTVAISGTEATVRASWAGCALERVSADGVRGRLQ